MNALGSARTSRPVLGAVVVTGFLLGAFAYVLVSSPDTGTVVPLPPAAQNPAPARVSDPAVSLHPQAGLPPEARAIQNGRYVAVFLAAVTDPASDVLRNAQARATALGYQGGLGNLGCTRGAAEQLGLDPTPAATAYSVFFTSRAQAEQFATAYGSVLGIADITATCID